MRMAVFDIDGTLVRGPGTEQRFWLRLLREGLQGPRQLCAWSGFLLSQLPTLRRDTLRRNKAYLAGLQPELAAELATSFLPADLADAWFVPCLDRLRMHQADGDRVVLLSGTPDFIATAVAGALGVDEAIGTRCKVRSGRFSAEAPGLHPFAQAKAAILDGLCARYGVAPAQVTAYADSVHDLPLLDRVGRPVAVRPDRALGAMARRQGWEILGERRPRTRQLIRFLSPT